MYIHHIIVFDFQLHLGCLIRKNFEATSCENTRICKSDTILLEKLQPETESERKKHQRQADVIDYGETICFRQKMRTQQVSE